MTEKGQGQQLFALSSPPPGLGGGCSRHLVTRRVDLHLQANTRNPRACALKFDVLRSDFDEKVPFFFSLCNVQYVA